MATSGHAVAAATADEMAFATHELSGMEIVDVAPDRHDLADELMTNHELWRDVFLCPVVPRVNVQISSADAGTQHLDEHIVNANRRLIDLNEFEPGTGLGLCQRAHGGTLRQLRSHYAAVASTAPKRQRQGARRPLSGAVGKVASADPRQLLGKRKIQHA